MASATVLVVQNEANGGPRRFGDWLAEDGLGLDVRQPYDGTPLPDRLDHDAIVVLGGGLLPDDDAKAPWLARARALVDEALGAGVPTFGICLGGQLLAHVAGGSVQQDAGAPENGSTPIRMRAEAADDPLFCDLPPVVRAIEHHVDAVTALPGEARWLAETDGCPYQAFRVGERAWGVQFHPEVDAERIRQWNEDRLREQGMDREQLYRAALAAEPEAARVWRTVAGRFAEVVAGRTA